MQFTYDDELVVDITVQKIGKFSAPDRSELFYLLAFLKQNGIFQNLVSVFDTQKYKTSWSVSSYSYKNTEVSVKYWKICSWVVKMQKGQLMEHKVS